MSITLDDLKNWYVCKDVTEGFHHGRRTILRYANECQYALYAQRVNLDGPQPYEYLNYAKHDMASESVQGAVNAISNAKRAIHLTIDALFGAWGLSTAFKKANFPAKLEIMHTLDAFPVRMLKYLNQKRNLVEHEYKTIEISEATDFVDLSEMFLMLAYPYLKHATTGAFVGLENDDRCLEWQVDMVGAQILVSERTECPFFESSIGRVYYNFPDEDQNKNVIQVIKIEKSNQDDWLVYLDLFVYLTKRNANQLKEADSRGDGLFIVNGTGRFVRE